MEDVVIDESARDFPKLLGGKWVTAAISAAAELGLAEVLQEGPCTLVELAERAGCDVDALGRLVRVLEGESILEADLEGRYSLTAVGSQLRRDALGALALNVAAPYMWTPWAHLATSIRTRTPAFQAVHGRGLFDHLAANASDAEIYHAAIDAFTKLEARALARAFDFSTQRQVVDVGGGLGTLLTEVLTRWPHLRGVLIDRPGVVALAASRIEDAGIADRCELRGGDFFDRMPEGADTYVIKHVLHNWGDDQAVEILKNCARAMAPGGVILVVEGVLLPGPVRDATRLLDLEMLALCGVGRERTKSEFRVLFRRAGLRLEWTRDLAGTTRLISGRLSPSASP